MARQTKTKPTKGKNGVGDSMTVLFDLTDKSERRALEAARLLASKHGRRKAVMVAFLEALYTHYEATGDLLSSADISALMSRQQPATQRPAMGFTPAVGRQIAPPASPNFSTSSAQDEPMIIVEDAPNKVTAQEFANNFLASMGGFLD